MTSKTLCLFLFVIFYFSILPVQAQKELKLESRKSSYVPVSSVIKGGVSETKELPNEFYGTWQVNGKLVSSNNFNMFKLKSSDIWVLQKNNNVVTLTNPVTGATSSINVDNIRGKTAAFSKTTITPQKREYEKPTITVDGDIFYGADEFIMEEYENGQLASRTTVRYNIVGQKISGQGF
jgi:hypothetical protein